MEMAKAMSQLESQNGELQEKSRAADDARRQLERELLQLQNTLDTERRTCSQGSEEIRQLQGTYENAHFLCARYRGQCVCVTNNHSLC